MIWVVLFGGLKPTLQNSRKIFKLFYILSGNIILRRYPAECRVELN